MLKEKILVVEFANLLEVICDVLTDKDESEVEKILISIEDSEELKQLTFNQNRDGNEYLLTSDNKEEFINLICDRLSESNNRKLKSVIEEDGAQDYFELIVGGEEYNFGDISISDDEMYSYIVDELLNTEDNFNRLINENFHNELNKLKKEALHDLLAEKITEARLELAEFEF